MYFNVLAEVGTAIEPHSCVDGSDMVIIDSCSSCSSCSNGWCALRENEGSDDAATVIS